MKDMKTLDIEAHPWQIAFITPWLMPLETGESVIASGPYVRRALPTEKIDGIVERSRRSFIWPDERVYDVMGEKGSEIFYAAPMKDSLRFFTNAFSIRGV